ncbi:MAG: SpoIID/LytB domain-containing protein, partial [Deltaproteobacteria bacterium]|nr:SpoIID/LytB domain-containing protein [Deltaproteobacteria bacterium]
GGLPPGAPLGSSPQVRVCLCLTDGEATIRGTQATPIQASDLESKDSFKIKAAGDQLFVNGLPSKQKKITFQSDSPLGINCGIKRKQVRGRLVAGLENGKLLIVNLIDLEDYLFSAVTSDANSSWPLDTLKAQAVIARTYALYQQLHRQDWTYDLVDDEGEQIYSGTAREHPKGRQAVRETKGTIISYQGRPILAVRNSNSGGHTADSGEVFGLPKPYLVAQPDPESLKGKMARWQRKITPSQIEAALAAKGLKVTGLKDINPAVKGTCGRVIKMSLVSAKGTATYRTRTVLSSPLNFPEILIDVEHRNNQFIFSGRGLGHGVGYSQWGGATLGDTMNYEAILKFYYPGTTLTKMW